MIASKLHRPFAPSLSKPALSDAASGVEGGFSFQRRGRREAEGFDKLSPSGWISVHGRFGKAKRGGKPHRAKGVARMPHAPDCQARPGNRATPPAVLPSAASSRPPGIRFRCGIWRCLPIAIEPPPCSDPGARRPKLPCATRSGRSRHGETMRAKAGTGPSPARSRKGWGRLWPQGRGAISSCRGRAGGAAEPTGFSPWRRRCRGPNVRRRGAAMGRLRRLSGDARSCSDHPRFFRSRRCPVESGGRWSEQV